ncbi:MAG TPA: phosphoribosylaminoimidazolesuccinocarboxamide synthase [Bacillales bacterium]|nr:phosphoribosylaminoimidazolesuccinocarboxamide synthase [Bacillales bacterium]
MEQQSLLYEGKAKRIYETSDSDIVRVAYKDEATAFNAVKKANIAGKGQLNNAITSFLFEKLQDAGVDSHFIEKLSDTEQLVRKVAIIPLEVVVRNTVAGSLSKRLGIEEGTKLSEPIVEFYYKNDDLGDPLINEDHIAVLKAADPGQLAELKQKALRVNEVLIKLFQEIGIELVDFKLEFGLTAGNNILLADEISPDTCRLWDADTRQKFDKDVFRRDLGNLTDAYQEILTRLEATQHV